MPLITGLDIDRFRCFETLRVKGLSRVNLFVGKNNCGKTTVLEAIEAVVSVENPLVFYRSSVDRGESRIVRLGRQEPSVQIDVRRWFHGHRLEDGASFSVIAVGPRAASVARSITRTPPEDADAKADVPGRLWITLTQPAATFRLPSLPLTPDGYLGAGLLSDYPSVLSMSQLTPVGFVPTRRLQPSELTILWEGLVLTSGEETTNDALRLIDPRIRRFAMSGSGDVAAAQVLLQDAGAPVPLGSLGEGVSRILAIILTLVRARGGVVLVDEIENGLHWSVVPRVWRFLVEIARSLDVQVFATTHSKDCLDAIARLHAELPDLAADISVFRLEEGREEPARLSASRVAEYMAMELEAR